MPEQLMSLLLEKLGTPTLALMAFAVLWDRVSSLREIVHDHAQKLWDLHNPEGDGE